MSSIKLASWLEDKKYNWLDSMYFEFNRKRS